MYRLDCSSSQLCVNMRQAYISIYIYAIILLGDNMVRVKVKYIFYIVAMLVMIVSFQNCGSGFESIEILERNTSIVDTKDIPVKDIDEAIEPNPRPVEEVSVTVEPDRDPAKEVTSEPDPPAEVTPPANPEPEPVAEVTPPVTPEPDSEESDEDVKPNHVASCNMKEQFFIANTSDTIIIEAENTTMTGKWETRPAINGSTGAGVVVYRRSDSPNNRDHSYDGVSELVYNIFVHEAGNYDFTYRGARYKGAFNYTVFGSHDNTNCPPSKNNCTHADLNNDAFVSTSNGLAPTKLFAAVGNSTDNWKIARTFDRNHNKTKAQVNLKAGLNKIFIRGRSTFFAIDKIFIFRGNQPNDNAAESEVGCP